MEMMKVSAKSKPSKVAGALTCLLRENHCVQIQVIGAGALNQAMKAIAISRGYVASSGMEIYCVPSFYDLSIEGETVTSLRLNVEIHEKDFSFS